VVASVQSQLRNCRRHYAAAGDQIFGVQHSGGATGAVERTLPSNRVRRGDQSAAAAVDHHSRRRVPFPYGGKTRVISVDLIPPRCTAALAPADVVNAVNIQNLILPSGTAKFGETEYTVKMNGSPRPSPLNDLPVRTNGGATTICATSPMCATFFAADQCRAAGRQSRRAAGPF